MIGTLVFLASAMALLSFWAARALTSPLTRFAAAAEQFRLSGAQAPLAEHGATEVRTLARALNDMQTRIRRMVDERTRMLAAVGHDLRTPITRLRLRAEDIADQALRSAVLRDLDGMQALVHATLSFLRDQSARGRTVRTDLPSLVQSICDDFADLGGEIDFSGPARLEVDCDPDQLKRAIVNVIENGLKFGHRVAVRIHADADGAAVIEVVDDGPGIPDAEKERVLEPFYRGDAARGSESRSSFGLGLTIARTIMDAHGGGLELRDAAPHGLIVRLTLPQAGGGEGPTT
jgi:signal transduction histidine kinase